MNIKEILDRTVAFFRKHDIPEPRLDAEVLLSHLLNIERIKLYVNFDLPLQQGEVDAYRELIKKRVKRIPVAYLTGKKEFMSLDFIVNADVLIPRPETEILVETVLDYCQKQELSDPNIVDVGTGSGAIAVSLGYNIKSARIVAIDISEAALNVASENIHKYNLSERVKTVPGSLLEPLIKRNKKNVDIVISNPPYLTEKEMQSLQPEIKYEPARALAAGLEGLHFYQKLVPEATAVLREGGLLALEIGASQADDLKNILSSSDWQDIRIIQDYAGHDRVVTARYK